MTVGEEQEERREGKRKRAGRGEKEYIGGKGRTRRRGWRRGRDKESKDTDGHSISPENT